jgi:beta-lactamase regulating signal transducer with metallopeptidase domain
MDGVLNWLWQGCVVALVCAAMLRGLERARANVRYVVCWAALLLVVVLPWLPSPLPTLLSTAPPTEVVLSAQSDVVVSLPDAWWTSALVMLAAWVAWSGVCTLRFASAMIALRRARARTRAFPSQIESVLPHWHRVRGEGRRARLVVSDSVTAAAALGCGTPMIAVSPSLIDTLDAAELDRVVIHEWAHVQRRDDLVHLLQILVRMVAGWHPAVWWIDRRLHVERELACDETTVAITGSPKSYAACLLKLASLRDRRRPMLAAPAIVKAPGLKARVTRIVAPHRWIAPAWSRALAGAIVLALCVVSAGVGRLTLVEASALPLPFDVLSRPILHPRTGLVVPVAARATSDSPETRGARRPSVASVQSAPEPMPPTPSPSPASQPPAPAPPKPVTTINTIDTTLPVTHGSDELPGVPQGAVISPSLAPPAASKATDPKAPWDVAADAGKAVGRKSKDASVATAGFFSRAARRVAGSF